MLQRLIFRWLTKKVNKLPTADNLKDLSKRYQKDLVVVEYFAKKEDVNKAAFNIDGGRGKGTFIWEPLNTWESIFDKDGRANNYLMLYNHISKQFLKKG